MKKLLILIAILLLITSCSDKKVEQAKNKFANNVWIIDSIRIPMPITKNNPSGIMIVVPNIILKPKIDSTFGIYREQFSRFRDYYFSGDSIYLSQIELNGQNKFYTAYKYDYKDDKLVLTGKNRNFDYKDLYLTNLTKLFSGKNDFENSYFYKKLESECWYATYIQADKKPYLDNHNPKFYSFNEAFYRNDSIVKTPFSNEDDIFKFTNNGIYIFNLKDKKLKLSLRLDYFEENFEQYISLSGYNNKFPTHYKFKKIDKSLLKESKDLPEAYFIECNEKIAYDKLLKYIEKQSTPDYHYGVKTIKSKKVDDENCVYIFDFTVVQTARDSDFAFTISGTFKVSFFRTNKLVIERIE